MKMTTTHLTTAAVAALSIGMITSATTTSAQSRIECGGTHVVRAGDSLSQIAKDAYDDPGSFQIIYSANSRAIGPNPAIISVGTRLEIPCLGEVTPSTAASIVVETTTEQLPAPSTRQIRIAQGTGWAPFANEEQEQGGMLTEITNVALSNSANGTDYKIDFINDWGAHLTPLITDQAYDFSLGWFKPNCDVIDRLGEDSQFRCNNFDWTDPMFEQIFGYYTRESDPAPASYDDMLGKTICRPSGFATFQLEENNLKEPNITLAREDNMNDCFIGLHDGRYDVVALAVDSADGAMVATDTTDKTRYNEDLSQVLTLHAVISNNHPQGEEMLAEFNSGLAAIKDTGEWFQIVRRHLTAHRAQTQN